MSRETEIWALEEESWMRESLTGMKGIEGGGGEEDMEVEEGEECGCSMNGSDSNCKQKLLV